MNVMQHFKRYLLLGFLLSLPSNISLADPRMDHAEKVFANNAKRHELVDAYLRKCSEKRHLLQDLEEARKNSCSFKTLVKAFTVGAVVGVAASAILYILTR